jgi:1-acyl-sn-glycerol-3-phosphate acyltransferase
LIFPEGTRRDGQILGSFRKGAFKIAIESGVKIQPIIIQKYSFIDHDKKLFGRGELKVKILPAMEIYEGETADEYSRRAYELMSSEYQKINE